MVDGWGDNAAAEQPAANGWGSPPEAEVTAPVVKYEVLYVGQPDTEEPEAFRLRRNAEIEAWLNAKPVLEQAKTVEMDLRKQVSSTLFPSPRKGTQRYALGGGFNIKLVFGMTYTLGNKEAVDEEGKKIAIAAQVSKLENAFIEKHGEAGLQLLKRVIEWKPELKPAEYEKLTAEDPLEVELRNAIDEILTIKPASPTLEFEPPKEV